MDMVYLVKEGKSWLFPHKLKTVAALDTPEEAEQWILDHIQKGQHMYIYPAERVNKKDVEDLFNTYGIINVKGV